MRRCARWPESSRNITPAARRRVAVNLDDYAEVPAIRGCYALMPTREEALAELGCVFETLAAEYGEKGPSLPADRTASVTA